MYVFLYLCVFFFCAHEHTCVVIVCLNVTDFAYHVDLCVCRLVQAQLTRSVPFQHVLATSMETVATYIHLPGP